MRYTFSNLQKDIEEANRRLAYAGKAKAFEVTVGDGHTKLYEINYIGRPEGPKRRCMRAMEVSSPRACELTARLHEADWMAEPPLKLFRRNRALAKMVLAPFINFDADPHTLGQDEARALLVWAKATKYRQSRTAPCAKWVSFFNHLAKLK